MLVRMWHGMTRAEDAAEYLRFLEARAVPDYRSVPGNLGVQILHRLEGDRAVLTGDTVLGRGTTVIAHPDGSLGPYLDSLRRLADLPPGTRCRFSMFQDEKGGFTKASLVTDEFTRLASNAITHRSVRHQASAVRCVCPL